MLYIGLVLALILLFIANVAVRRPGYWPAFFLCGVGFTFGPACLAFFLPPVGLLFSFLIVVLLVWWGCRRPRRIFLPLSCLAAVAAFGIPGWYAVAEQQEFASLREE